MDVVAGGCAARQNIQMAWYSDGYTYAPLLSCEVQIMHYMDDIKDIHLILDGVVHD